MNDRYQTDNVKGQTKKSAASLKPKSKAATSVYVKSTQKTPKEQREARREQQRKVRELERKYYDPPTPEYKRLRTIWWIVLGASIVLTILAMLGSTYIWPGNETLTWACLIPAYGGIIVALWLDFSKIRKVRMKYQEEMLKKHPKEAKKHPATAAANKAAAKKEAEREAAKAESKGNFFTNLFKKKSDEDSSK